MNNYAEQHDYWNADTQITVSKLEVLPLKVKPNQDNPDEVTAGQLFTTVIHMTSQNGNNIDVTVTGYLRGTMRVDEPRAWTARDCHAPRKHMDGVPPVRLMSYPKNLCAENGEPLTAMGLSRLIAEQLKEDTEWREQVCQRVEPVTDSALSLAVQEAAAESGATTPPASSPAGDSPNIRQFQRSDETPQAEQGSTEAAADQITEPEPTLAEETKAESYIDLDDVAGDPEQDDHHASSTPNSEQDEPAAQDSPEADALDDGEDIASLVDEDWDDDLEALGGNATEDTIDSLAQLDDASALQAPGTEPESVTGDQRDGTSRLSEWATEKTAEPPVETETADVALAPEPSSGAHEADAEAATPAPVEAEADEAQGEVEPSDTQTVPQSQVAPMKPRLATVPQTSRTPAGRELPLEEHILYNEQDYDIGFIGREHGEAEVVSDQGSKATLFTTRGGLRVAHIDNRKVLTVPPQDEAQLFELLGFGREAKALYKSAGVVCVKWLD